MVDSQSVFASTRRRLAGLLALLFVAGLVTPGAYAQDEPLAEGRAAYDSGDFDLAIAQFSEIAGDESVEKPIRREALEYLGRSYVAKQSYDQARGAMEDLLTLEPPVVELDPDFETPRLMEVYYEVRKDLCGSYTVEPTCGERQDGPRAKTLAIADFTNAAIHENETYEPMRQGIASLLINQLSGATDLKLVERERIQWILSELDLQRSGIADQSTAVQVGKLLGASYVLFGTFYVQKSFLSRKMVLSARLVDVETSEILMADQVTGKPKRIFDLAEKLSLKVAQGINVTIGPDGLAERTPKSMDALLAYSEGLQLLEREAYPEALRKFEEALQHDPEYTKAQRKASAIRPIVAANLGL